MKYFEFNDGSGNIWNCTALPFDRDLMIEIEITTIKKQTIFVKEIPKDLTAAKLEEKFKDIAPVKYC